MVNVTVQTLAYNEPDYSGTLDAIASQRLPDWVSPTFEVWVTPNGPKDADPTWHQAADHSEFVAREAPEGYISTRNRAHTDAMESGADIIVKQDSDAPPLTDDSLERLIDPMVNENAVASKGNLRAPGSPLGIISRGFRRVWVNVYDHIPGTYCGFTADAWNHAGPFSESVMETDRYEAWKEVEVRFHRRLSEIGDISAPPGALAHKSMRRWDCAFTKPFEGLGVEQPDFCSRTGGNVTFTPRRRYR